MLKFREEAQRRWNAPVLECFGNMIDLYTAATPNGWKVAIAFKEMELPYNPIVLNLSERKQHEEWFLKMNPNGRIPVIVDHDADHLTVLETGAIMLYLPKKRQVHADGPQTAARRDAMADVSDVCIGPMQGQAVAFERVSLAEDAPAARKLSHNETRRLYEVLDWHLADHEWLADDTPIADMANWPGTKPNGVACRQKVWNI